MPAESAISMETPVAKVPVTSPTPTRSLLPLASAVPVNDTVALAPVAGLQFIRSMVNLAGVERLPTPPSSEDLATVPSGTVRFALLGETEHGVSMILPTKFTLPSAARAAWADAASATSTAALVRERDFICVS